MLRKTSPVSISLVLAFGIGCSGSKEFAGGVAKTAIKASAAGAATTSADATIRAGLVQKTQDFEVKKVGTPIDMVWVIDNSGSMEQEVAQVRKNFGSYMATVSARTDLRVTVISNTDKKLGLILDPTYVAQGHEQIINEVGSHNEFDILAAAVCAPEETLITPLSSLGRKAAQTAINPDDKLCGVALTDASSEMKMVDSVKGKIKARLRDGTKKVFVFVSDDNPNLNVKAATFIRLTKSDAANTHVFSFSGIAKSSTCSIANVGTGYQELATATGGAVFDICADDWSANFNKLSDNIVKLSSTSFSVVEAKGTVTIKKVLLDNVELPATAYKITGSTVALTDEGSALSGTTLHIVYDYAQ
ncbi:MAG: hypothetical protein H7249_05135 [Chitinophagaceae bacterium]|nr:hypothetical protein [Oligoflexus sp.]